MTPPLTAPSTGNKHQPCCLCSWDWGCSAVLDVGAQQGGHLESDIHIHIHIHWHW